MKVKKPFEMKELFKPLFLVFMITSCATVKPYGKNRSLIHKIEFTASSVELINWNTNDTINAAFVREFIDDAGRTKELRFFNSKKELNWAGSGFYGGPIIKYDYQKDKIIETFFSAENELASDFKASEVPYRHIYYLNADDEIIEVKEFYKMDFEWSKESFEQTIKHLEFYKQYPNEGSELPNVFGYQFAFRKMNGKNPETI